jgi:hypothetical protein
MEVYQGVGKRNLLERLRNRHWPFMCYHHVLERLSMRLPNASNSPGDIHAICDRGHYPLTERLFSQQTQSTLAIPKQTFLVSSVLSVTTLSHNL